MLNVFTQQPHGLNRLELSPPLQIPETAIWLDLLVPTPDEEKAVEALLGVYGDRKSVV